MNKVSIKKSAVFDGQWEVSTVFGEVCLYSLCDSWQDAQAKAEEMARTVTVVLPVIGSESSAVIRNSDGGERVAVERNGNFVRIRQPNEPGMDDDLIILGNKRAEELALIMLALAQKEEGK